MTATYYDRRAERTVAEAAAEQARAAAEATRAETALRLERERRRMDAETAAADRQDRADRAETKAARRRERRAESRKARAERAAAVRRGAGALASAVITRAPLAVGGIAMGAPIVIAWRGQMEFAGQVMHLGALAPALPVALEGAAWYLAYLTHRAIKGRLPAGGYRVWTWGLASLAAAMNLWHGAQAHGVQAGVVLALASLLGILLWELTASLAVQTESKRTATEIRRAAWRRVRYPRLSWAAASIRAAHGADCSIDQAWAAAWIDRYGVGPESSRRERKLARSIVRHQSKADRRAARNGRLSIVAGSIVGRPSIASASIDVERIDLAPIGAVPEPIDRPAIEPTPAPIDPAPGPGAPVDDRADAVTGTGGPAEDGRAPQADRPIPIDFGAVPIESAPPTRGRSIGAHREALRTAIEAGSIDPAQATAEGIRKILRCAPKTAQTLRDEIRTEATA
ncbi:hypothetical protein GCM10017673_05060 [Streptosporangium violaceochromogenes]|nr:hypothetical protein GCM10017673_05060 [Streptosporangium violaceochromogenes]